VVVVKVQHIATVLLRQQFEHGIGHRSENIADVFTMDKQKMRK
jgi:hypothetical protein